MLASFTLLVHIRILFADHKTQFNWTELAINVTLVGAAWIVADSFASREPSAPPLTVPRTRTTAANSVKPLEPPDHA